MDCVWEAEKTRWQFTASNASHIPINVHGLQLLHLLERQYPSGKQGLECLMNDEQRRRRNSNTKQANIITKKINFKSPVDDIPSQYPLPRQSDRLYPQFNREKRD
jgi:hypothetical protein